MLKKTFWIFCAAYWLFGMHFFMHNGGGYGLALPFNAWAWIYGSLLIGLGLWRITVQQHFVFSSLQTRLWTGALFLLVPLLYPHFEFKALATARLLGLGAGLLFLFCLYQWSWTRQDRNKMLHLLLGAVAIEAALGLVQFYLLTPNNWIGYDTRINRPYGIFQQPNVMATFMATGLALAIWLELHHVGRNWLKMLRYGVIIVTCWLLVLLQSRIGQLSGLVVLFLLTVSMRQRGQLGLIMGLVTLGLTLGIATLLVSDQVIRDMSSYRSVGMRPTYWIYSAKLIAQAPWAGWGYGGFESTMLHRYMADKALQPDMLPLEANLDHPHNELLYWGVEGGLVPLLGLMLIALALLRRITSIGWPQGMSGLALLAPIALHTQVEYPLYHAASLWWTLLLLVYVLDVEIDELGKNQEKRELRSLHFQPKWLLRMAAVYIPFVVIPFMLTGLHTQWALNLFEAQGRVHVDLLQTIVNPLALPERMQTIMYTLRLQKGLLSSNTTELEAYLAWGQSFVQHTPRAQIYANMTLALKTLGRLNEAKAMQARGLQLFPDNKALLRHGIL